jgi:abortive infection bacteriophage resistance protein
MVFEVLSFGTVSQVFKNLIRENQKPIAAIFGMDGGILASWLHTVSYLRNVAAHHQRLWNRVFTIKPQVAKKLAAEMEAPARFYAQAVIIEVLLKKVSPETHWGTRLETLLAENPRVPIDRMGFPAGWNRRELWRA